MIVLLFLKQKCFIINYWIQPEFPKIEMKTKNSNNVWCHGIESQIKERRCILTKEK